MTMRLLILFSAFSFQLSAFSTTWYAAATGSSTNGTSALPWGVQYSVTNNNPFLQAGDTVIFKTGGTYVTTETNEVLTIGHVLEFRKSGTPSSPITYRPATLWGFTFDGGLLLTSSNLVIEQFRINNSVLGALAYRVSSNIYDYPAGISDYAPGNKLLHNLIENVGQPGIGSWKATRGKYIAGNIIRFTGFDDWTEMFGGGNWNGAPRGSGLYLQNADDSAEALIQGQISYCNYTTGMKAYGNTDIWKFNFHNNICTDNSEAGIFYHQDNYPGTNLTVRGNYLWQNGMGIRVGYPNGNGGHSNAVVADNYIYESGTGEVPVSYPFYQVDGWSGNTWTNNVAVRRGQRYLWYLEESGETSGDIASHHIDRNTYYAEDAGVGGSPYAFFIKAVTYYLDTWQAAVHGDTNSAFYYGIPTANSVYAFAPSTDTNFVHVAVFNWTNATTTTVNLSAWFPAGARLAIYDAQNIPAAYTNLTFGGTTVSLDLTRTNRATMLGTFTQRSAWAGFDPRFRAFVIYSQPGRTLNAGTFNVGGGQ